MLKIKFYKNKIDITKFEKPIIIIDNTSEKYINKLKTDKNTKTLNISKIGDDSPQKIEESLRNFYIIISFGGGKTIDFAKHLAYKYKKQYITIPISLSSDVAFTPTISIKLRKTVKTIYYKLPSLVLISKKIILSSPKETIKAGICDAIAKFVALKDWEIAENFMKEKINKKSYNYSLRCAKMVYKNIDKITKGKVSKLLEAFKFSGLAAHYAKSSRPISGSEHNFSHAIDLFSSRKSLHGFQVGIGCIIMRNLQIGYDDLNLCEIFKEYNIPTNYKEIKIPKNDIVNCFLKAKYVRKRFTVLNTIRLTKNFAIDLLSKLKII